MRWDFDVAFLHNPQCAGCLYERGTVKMLSGEMAEAMEGFSKCVELDPRHAAGKLLDILFSGG